MYIFHIPFYTVPLCLDDDARKPWPAIAIYANQCWCCARRPSLSVDFQKEVFWIPSVEHRHVLWAR